MNGTTKRPRPVYDAARVEADMADRGWNGSDLARETGLSAMTISKFLRGETQTAKVALKIAGAFGYKTARRYFSHFEAVA